MKIITVTLNPAFDIHCQLEGFMPFHENLATVTERDAGGKGVNISRALSANGVVNTAIVVMGEENAADFQKCLSSEGIRTKSILVPGRIRENITIHEENNKETRISFLGFQSNNIMLDQVKDEIFLLLEKENFITFTGRVPDGINIEDVKRLLRQLTERGCKIVLDSRSFEIEDIIDVKPWLIKPNQEEISHYLGKDIQTKEQAVIGALALKEKGIENVMISMGEQGAILVCNEGAFVATAPSIQVESTIGAGDSAVAGFLVAASSSNPPDECLKTAVAYGSAACMQKGTKAPKKDDIRTLLKEITVRRA